MCFFVCAVHFGPHSFLKCINVNSITLIQIYSGITALSYPILSCPALNKAVSNNTRVKVLSLDLGATEGPFISDNRNYALHAKEGWTLLSFYWGY